MSNQKEKLLARIENDFTYHPPTGTQIDRYTQIRSMTKHVAFNLIQHCPPSYELDIALTRLEEVVMWANAAIARNEAAVPVETEEADRYEGYNSLQNSERDNY